MKSTEWLISKETIVSKETNSIGDPTGIDPSMISGSSFGIQQQQIAAGIKSE